MTNRVLKPRASKAIFSAAFCATCLGAQSLLLADYEVPNAAYNPPTTYYNAASGTGFTLRTNLHNIITTGFVGRSYGDSRWAMGTGGTDSQGFHVGGTEDVDPNNSSNIKLVYNRGSIPALWDGGTTWNREHTWPKFWLNVTSNQVSNTYIGVASDSFELRPADTNINSGRGDDGYGFYPSVGNGSPAPKAGDVSTVTNYGSNTNAGTTYWYPGDADRGEIARGMFYMATRWFDPTDSTRGDSNQNLDLKNGAPALFQLGDLNSFLHWNYISGVDNFERRRNQLIYGSSGNLTDHALNPTYYQGNRNPYIDHPEYVWAIFGSDKDGGGNIINNSQIYVGGAPNADGSSNSTVNLGRVIKNAALSATSSVTMNKTGADPTTYDITTANGATSTAAGTGQPMDYGSQVKNMTVGLTASTSTVGVKSGTVTIDNTDLTTSAAGHGSADGNDVVTVNATVVDHSNGSFNLASDVDSQTIDFGYVPQGFASRSQGYNVFNLVAASGFTANMDIKSVGSSGSTATLNSNATTTSAIAPGSSAAFNASLSTGTPGVLASTYTITPGDEVIPGATNNAAMTLNLTSRVISSATFPVTGFMQLNNGETYNSGAFAISPGVTLTLTGPGTLNITGAQTNGAGSALTANAGITNINTDAGSAGSLVLALSASNVGTIVNLNSTQHLSSVSAALGAKMSLASGGAKTLVTQSLTITDTSTLDLNNNAIIVNYSGASPLSQIRQLLLNGRGPAGFGNATWNGTGGIISSVASPAAQGLGGIGNGVDPAIGYGENSAMPIQTFTSFAGESVGTSSILIKYTRGADATLDGVVDNSDVTVVGTEFNNPSSGQWYLGDFDYSGTCDNSDVTALGTLFNPTAPPLSPAQLNAEFGSAFAQAFAAGQASAAVPEPTSVGLVAASLILLAGRRRRRSFAANFNS